MTPIKEAVTVALEAVCSATIAAASVDNIIGVSLSLPHPVKPTNKAVAKATEPKVFYISFELLIIHSL